MKIPVWYLLVLLASVFTPGRGDCQGECVACGALLQQQQLPQAFNALVCFLECEGGVSSSFTWEVCQRAMKLSRRPSLPGGGAVLGRTGEGLELTYLDMNPDSQLPQSAAAAEQDGAPFEQRSAPYDSSLLESYGQPEGLRGQEASGAVTLSKRFGGFQRGRHGYRKLIGSSMRPLQKRYGGFIGVRKSARKWNSQKRVNQLLRQYLGLRSSRSGRVGYAPVTRVWRQNQL
uniref:Prepronociceptin b n=1 Tax=Gasterosteus aculeatus TaxID=69293 RepID=G3NKL3_GASAC